MLLCVISLFVGYLLCVVCCVPFWCLLLVVRCLSLCGVRRLLCVVVDWSLFVFCLRLSFVVCCQVLAAKAYMLPVSC